MYVMRYIFIFTFLIILPCLIIAQEKDHTAWLALNNSTKFNRTWGMHLDVQFRSADRLEYLRNFMFRPGLTYHLNKKANLTLGYMLNDTYTPSVGSGYNRLTEHRVWEQLLYNVFIGSTVLTNRLRLEQRFIEQSSSDVFSQRLRYMLRAVVPVTRQDSTFKKGLFIGLQDEVFLNLQNKSKLNGSVFDQNRAYLAIGYRFSPKLDLEAGYLNQFINGKSVNTSNNVMQVAVYTRF